MSNIVNGTNVANPKMPVANTPISLKVMRQVSTINMNKRKYQYSDRGDLPEL